jgi:PAS domain S-box-containing protein
MQNKVIELKPAAADRRYRVLAEALTDLAVCTLDPQGRIESWNPGAERLLGFSAAEAIGQPLARVHGGERQAAAALAAAAESGRHETEGWRTRRDGSRFWAASVLVAVRDEAGRVTPGARRSSA